MKIIRRIRAAISAFNAPADRLAAKDTTPIAPPAPSIRSLTDEYIDLCQEFAVPEAKSLPAKEVRAVMRRYKKGNLDFVALVIASMQAMQNKRRSHLERGNGKSHRAALGAEPLSRLTAEAEHLYTLAALPNEKFYRTPEWRRLRLEALRLHGGHCDDCGAGKRQGHPLFVVHKKPRFLAPHLAFEIRNLWVLCADCREGMRLLTQRVRRRS